MVGQVSTYICMDIDADQAATQTTFEHLGMGIDVFWHLAAECREVYRVTPVWVDVGGGEHCDKRSVMGWNGLGGGEVPHLWLKRRNHELITRPFFSLATLRANRILDERSIASCNLNRNSLLQLRCIALLDIIGTGFRMYM